MLWRFGVIGYKRVGIRQKIEAKLLLISNQPMIAPSIPQTNERHIISSTSDRTLNRHFSISTSDRTLILTKQRSHSHQPTIALSTKTTIATSTTQTNDRPFIPTTNDRHFTTHTNDHHPYHKKNRPSGFYTQRAIASQAQSNNQISPLN